MKPTEGDEKPTEEGAPEQTAYVEKSTPEEIEAEQSQAATKIQAKFRGDKARKEVLIKKEQTEAAIKIQSKFRGDKDRQRVAEKRENLKGET